MFLWMMDKMVRMFWSVDSNFFTCRQSMLLWVMKFVVGMSGIFNSNLFGFLRVYGLFGILFGNSNLFGFLWVYGLFGILRIFGLFGLLWLLGLFGILRIFFCILRIFKLCW